MGMVLTLFCILALVRQTDATHGVATGCFECAQQNSGNNYMCDWGGFLADPNDVVCCAPDSSSTYCTASVGNSCSGSRADTGFSYFTYCPGITGLNCGLTTNTTSMEVFANEETQTIEYDQLFWKNEKYKTATEDVCYYQIGNPTYTYSSGKVYIKFTRIGGSVSVYITSGSDVRNASTAVVTNNATVTVDTLYEVDQSENMIVYAIPTLNEYDTGYAFEYWTDGVKYDEYTLMYFDMFKRGDDGDLFEMIALACAGVFVVVCCCGCCFMIVNMCKKKTGPNKVIDEYSEQRALTEYNEMKNQNLNNSGTQGPGNDLELVSINSEEGPHTGNPLEGDGPKILRDDKKNQDAQMKEMYANPFKKKNKVDVMQSNDATDKPDEDQYLE